MGRGAAHRLDSCRKLICQHIKGREQAYVKHCLLEEYLPTWGCKISSVRRQLDAIEQEARVVNGKSFYQNGAQWIDSTAQNAKAAKSQRIKFASAEYFDLLAKNQDAAQWLALGQNVQFTLGDTLYEVFE